MNIHTFMLEMREVPDHVLYIDGLSGQKRTRGEFKARVALARTALGSKVEQGGIGLDSESMIAILSENCIVSRILLLSSPKSDGMLQEYPTIILALCSLAVPFACCSAYATQYELAHSLRLSKASHIFVHADLLDTALQGAHEVGIPRSRVYILEGKANAEFTSLEEFIARAEKRNLSPIVPRPVTRDQLAFLLFSSGTTGLPKGMIPLVWTRKIFIWTTSRRTVPYQHNQQYSPSGHLDADRVGINQGTHKNFLVILPF
jgi:acyl-CoA synthetase (AMP-forming)/AMP-acid ligase II